MVQENSSLFERGGSMKKASSWSSKQHCRDEKGQDDTVKRQAVKNSDTTDTLDEELKETVDSAKDAATHEDVPIEKRNTADLSSIQEEVPDTPQTVDSFIVPVSMPQRAALPRSRAILLAALLLILVIKASTMSFAQFIGPQGWAYVLGGPASTSNPNLLNTIANQLHHRLTPGATAIATQQITPQQYINLI